MMKDFKIVPHTADLQIRVYGKDQKELFKNALIGMFQSIVPITDDKNCHQQNDRLICSKFSVSHKIKVSSSELELLLIDFLSEALYLCDVNNEAYLNVEIHELSDNYIEATLQGISITGFEVVEIKAVTYHNLKIEFKDGMWQADVVFDI